ncbi:MAG: hypothetical protein AAGA54_23965 [Myxococcota bacterium]
MSLRQRAFRWAKDEATKGVTKVVADRSRTPGVQERRHDAMSRLLTAKAAKHKVVGGKSRLRWHRVWRRIWKARYPAFNDCTEPRGCD